MPSHVSSKAAVARVKRSAQTRLRRSRQAMHGVLVCFAPAVMATALTLAATVFVGKCLHLSFLKTAAGYTPAENVVTFDAANAFMTNIKTAAMPLAVPASLIAMVVGAVGIMYGREWGGRWLSGALGGAVLVFLSPQILA